jgi:small basic protein (TIGR04137 family)
MDRSLKVGSGLTRHRNVLNRAERIAKLKEQEKWNDENSVFGLVKVANRNVKVGKKAKKKEEETAAAAASGAPATEAAPKKEAAPAKK